MPRGVKKGVNHFEASQQAKVNYRLKRIKEIVLPQIKALAPHVKISSVNRYAKLVCEVYNQDLPVSESPLGVRTVTQNSAYWEVLGTLYYQLFESSSSLKSFKSSVIESQRDHLIQTLTLENDRLLSENAALKSAFTSFSDTSSGGNTSSTDSVDSVSYEYLCKIIDKLIFLSDGVIEIDLERGSIHDRSNDLDTDEGILSREVVAPYIEYIQKLKKKCWDYDSSQGTSF